MHINKPYLLFLGDVHDQLAAKTAIGVAHWRPDDCTGQLRLPDCKADLGLPDLGLYEAAERGAKTLLIGVANSGGVLPTHWVKELIAALDAGFDIASGLHMRLNDIPELKEKADTLGRHLFDVRHPIETFNTGNGKPRTGKRLLTVGTDCSVGKMYTSLALEQALRKRLA